MNRSMRATWPRRHTLLRRWMPTLWGAAILAGTYAVEAATPQLPARPPAGASVALEIPDTGAFWSKLRALPLAKALESYLATPTVQQDPDFQAFERERRRLTEELGYPATPDEWMGNVFASALLYLTPARGADPPALVVQAGIKDRAKATRLLEAVDRRLEQRAAAGEGQWGKVKVGEHEAARFRTSGLSPREVYYALIGERAVLAASEAAFAAAADEATSPSSRLGSDPVFARLFGLLAPADSDLLGWVDGDALLRQAAGMLNPLAGVAPALTGGHQMAFSLRVTATGIGSKAALSLDPARQSPRIVPGELATLRMTTPRPLLATASRMFDPDTLDRDLGTLGALGALARGLGGATGESPAEALARATGISLREELIPALGGEVGLAINSVRVNLTSSAPDAPPAIGTLPQVDLVLAARVRDAAAMRSVMSKLESYLQQRYFPGIAFQDLHIGPSMARQLPISGNVFAPSYIVLPDRMLIALHPEALIEAVNRSQQAGAAMAGNAVFAQLAQLAGGADRLYDYSQLDLTGLARLLARYVSTIALMAPQADALRMQQLIDQVLVHLGTVASVTGREGETVVQYGLWQME